MQRIHEHAFESLRATCSDLWGYVIRHITFRYRIYVKNYTSSSAIERRRLSSHNLEPLLARESPDGSSSLSPFLNLPVEIRKMIYEYCFRGCEELHIEHVRYTRWWMHRDTYLSSKRNQKRPYFGKQNCNDSKGYTSLPFTCRQLYGELIDDLYAKTRFTFTHAGDVVGFHHSLTPHRWACITDIDIHLDWSKCGQDRDFSSGNWWGPSLFQLTDWDRACQAMAAIPNLQRLVVLFYWELGAWRELKHALPPLMQITRPEIFQVRSMPECTGVSSLEQYRTAPFELQLMCWNNLETWYEPWFDRGESVERSDGR